MSSGLGRGVVRTKRHPRVGPRYRSVGDGYIPVILATFRQLEVLSRQSGLMLPRCPSFPLGPPLRLLVVLRYAAWLVLGELEAIENRMGHFVWSG